MWRNGRRNRLKIDRRKAWGFESLHGHHFNVRGCSRLFAEGQNLSQFQHVNEPDPFGRVRRDPLASSPFAGIFVGTRREPRGAIPTCSASVRAAKPGAKPVKLSDSGGLYLLVQPHGSKLWRLAYRFNGKQKTLAFGVYPTVSLADARNYRDEAKKLLARSIDPSMHRKVHKHPKADGSFRAIAGEVIAKLEREGRAPATITKKRWLLDLAFTSFGDRPVGEISAQELLALFREVEVRGLYETANRLRSTCGMVFRYAIATGRAERDPTVDLRGALTTPQVNHRATIVDPKKIGALLRAIDGFDGQVTTRCALRLVAYLFVRPSFFCWLFGRAC